MTTFTAPDVSSSTLLQFQLTVTDPLGLSDTASVSVTVTSSTGSGGGLGSTGSGGGALDLWLLVLIIAAIFARSRLERRSYNLRSLP